jgi:hypothetical protein
MVKEAFTSTQSLKGYKGDDLVPINKKSKDRKRQNNQIIVLEYEEWFFVSERCLNLPTL